jgi:hypothetical protein
MALLFLKQKLFPTKGKQPRSDNYGSLISALYRSIQPNRATVKPLLSASDSDTLGSDAEQDLEAQRSYRTFHPPRSDSDSVSSSSSTPRSRINPRIISDAILGLSDGLTVPFALSAGLSALGNTKVVVLGGLAELAAGAISMGLGGYVGAKSEAYVSRSRPCCVRLKTNSLQRVISSDCPRNKRADRDLACRDQRHRPRYILRLRSA